MDYSRKISQRLWNLPEKGEQESHREETFIDDIVQKSFIERKLLENLDGVEDRVRRRRGQRALLHFAGQARL